MGPATVVRSTHEGGLRPPFLMTQPWLDVIRMQIAKAQGIHDNLGRRPKYLHGDIRLER